METEKRQGRSWYFTVFNYTEADKQQFRDMDARRVAIGEEICPTTNQPHLHVFIEFTRNYRFKALKKLRPTDHIEFGMDWNYALKDQKYEIIDRRTPSQQGKRTDIANLKSLVKKGASLREITDQCESLNFQQIKIIETFMKYHEPPRSTETPLTVYWIYGSPGSGKSKLASEMAPDGYRPTSSKWFNGYDGQKDLILDDLRATEWDFVWLLKILDRYPLRIESKGGDRQAQWNRVIITTCHQPEYTYRRYIDEDMNQLLRRITNYVVMDGMGPKVGIDNTSNPNI